MTTDRVDRVRDFFASGGSVCPFAKGYLDRIGFAEVPDPYRTHQVRYPVMDLVSVNRQPI